MTRRATAAQQLAHTIASCALAVRASSAEAVNAAAEATWPVWTKWAIIACCTLVVLILTTVFGVTSTPAAQENPEEARATPPQIACVFP